MNKVMQNNKIYLKSPLTTEKLIKHIKTMLFKINISQYVSIHTKLMFNKNNFPTYSLGSRCYLDLNNNRDKNKYINYVTNLYLNKPKLSYSKRVTGIYFSHKQLSKQSYLNLKDKVR